jgi:hypothetical protein
MKLKLAAILLGVSLGVVLAQEKPEQYPGQKDHAAPPDNWFCSGAPNTPADHKCACKNMPKDPKDPICAVYENEDDPQCSSWCHREKCACKASCPDT